MQLAKLVGISKLELSSFESGNETPSLEQFEKLAIALSVHPAVLAFPDFRLSNEL